MKALQVIPNYPTNDQTNESSSELREQMTTELEGLARDLEENNKVLRQLLKILRAEAFQL